ncbi:DUF1501 domain-containing protein [Janthinobacterium fluminis]|uniref:DUF1501 domain-containing protein n=1 Tax=Janthinobacterium fluminis TaxID=2987524 RepID=A0ABT5K538_9BURK|nr:DUF1501 domain-containing protein [Janthinobacterium fluminis]MDC8760039.1 DUF1501 domain-containing protein [Janthinobacterium fluminis]
MHRRDILKALGALPLAAPAGRLLAAPAAKTRLLFVFLRGGYDAANLLVPLSSSFYYEARPNIAIPRAGANAALALDADWGLHPALRDSIYPLFNSGNAAFVPFAGTTDLSRSHFETQDSIELGQDSGGRRDYRSGFLNRLAETLNGGGIAFTEQLPLIFQGEVQVPNMALREIGKPGLDARQSRIVAAMYRGGALERPVSDGFAVRADVLRELGGEMAAADRNAISAKGFELEARRIARLMRDKYHIGFVDVGGWDTHVGEGGATGYLAGRFEELGRGLAAFAQEMGDDWRDTLVVVVSEFGRTFRENGNRGTDHGHGSVFWVLGGGIRGKRIAGEQVRVERASLFEQRDFPVLNEYRAVLGGLFARAYGLSAAQLDHVFAGVKPRDLGLI